MDLMWLENNPVFHIVYIETGLKNAVFIKDKLVTSLCSDFFNCWESVYRVFLKTNGLYREKSFKSTEFGENADDLWIEHILSVIEACNSIRKGERYYHPLRRIVSIT